MGCHHMTANIGKRSLYTKIRDHVSLKRESSFEKNELLYHAFLLTYSHPKVARDTYRAGFVQWPKEKHVGKDFSFIERF